MSSDSSTEPHSSESATPDAGAAGERHVLSRSPSNDLSTLAAALVQAVKPGTSYRFNIAYTYGGFIALVPQRLGRNAALDASVSALTEAHSDFCSGRPATRSVLSKYSQALTKLRVCLNDPRVAAQSETLCSVMLLLITQVGIGVPPSHPSRANAQLQSFIGTGDSRPAASHVVGMAKLLKVRGTQHDPNDHFESLLLLTLRGPVVFEGLWNDQIQFSESQWQELVENHWDDGQRAEGVMMRCIAKLPVYVLRGRKVLRGEAIDPTLAQEVSNVYEQLLGAGEALAQRISNLDRKIECAGAEMETLIPIRDAAMRIDSFHLAVVMIAGCVLGVLSTFTPGLQKVLNECAAKIYSYVPWSQKWRPLGASYMLLSTSMAYTGTDDPDLKAKLRDAYIDQHRDFPSHLDDSAVAGSLDAGVKKFLSLGVDMSAYQSGETDLERRKQVNTSGLFD